MTRTLQKQFWMLTSPALAGIFGIWICRQFGFLEAGEQTGASPIAAMLFVLAIIFAAAAPIAGRLIFVHRVRLRRAVPEGEFIRFQQRQILIVTITAYLALAAYALAAPEFYLAGTVLAMLYGLYYHYPSQQRTDFDRRIFRVQ